MSDAVRVQRDGPVVTVLLSRPERRNTVDGATAAALADAFRAFDADPEAAIAVLRLKLRPRRRLLYVLAGRRQRGVWLSSRCPGEFRREPGRRSGSAAPGRTGP